MLKKVPKKKPGIKDRFKQAIDSFISPKVKSVSYAFDGEDEVSQDTEPMDQGYLFNFQNYKNLDTVGIYNVNGIYFNGEGAKTEGTARIKITPKEALDELETVPTPITLENIDGKVQMLRAKLGMLRQKYSRRDVEGLIVRLENRKKYLEYKDFFDSFPNTTDEKIEALTKKYELVLKPADLFIPEFPDTAVKIMKDYEEKCKLVCDLKPIFYVIATEESFKKSYERRDPILLVQSPFGFYWQILGA